MATKKAAPKRKSAKTTRAANAPKKPRRAAAKATRATSRAKARAARPVVLGEVRFLGALYRVVAEDPGLKTRQIAKLPADKDDIRAPNGKRIVWRSKLGPFRIVFDPKTPPDTRNPRRLDFLASPAGAKSFATERVELFGHDAGAKLAYEIYMPPDAAKPLDPSIIIDPAMKLRLVKA